MKQLALDFVSQSSPTLDNFIVGRNGELLANIRRLAAGQATERFLYLWGRPGSGRSHLLRGAVTVLQRAGTAAAYVACTSDTRPAEGLERMDCVALDDVDRLGEDGQVAVFSLYNVLRERGAALLAGGGAPPVQLKLREDLVTRLAWGLVYQVHGLSDEEKGRALAEYAAGRGFRLLPEVCDYLLTRASRDLPSLLGMLDALDRYSLETKRPVTVPLARELLHAAERDAGGRT
jgi:DnaA-homolog protein